MVKAVEDNCEEQLAGCKLKFGGQSWQVTF